MSNFSKFEELLRGSEELQAKFRAAAETFQGDKADARAVFEAVVAPLAAEAGLPFSYDEVKKAAGEVELDADEYDAVAGGGCFFFGGNDDSGACSNEEEGAGACSGLGVGFLNW